MISRNLVAITGSKSTTFVEERCPAKWPGSMEGNRKEKRKPLNQTSYMVHTIPYICKEKLSVNIFKWKAACFHPSAIAISRCITNQETFKKR